MIFLRAASLSTENSAERSNHWRVSRRNATSSFATSSSTELSDRPCVSRSTKLNTNALTPSGETAVETFRSSSSDSCGVLIL